MSSETLDFSADVSRLLDIVANALYSNKDVFLRELISNSSDACDRLRYEAIETPDLIKGDADYRIEIETDSTARTLTITDNGIGMSREEMIDNLGTIAKSGTRALMEQLQKAKEQDTSQSPDTMSLIGQFGVGFYASFMVAHKVEVVSRHAGSDDIHHWESDGQSGFEIRAASPEEAATLMSNRGTAVILHIKGDHSELFIDEKIKQIVETYSDHIDLPIYLGSKDDPTEDGEDKQPINQASALWVRSKDEITQDQYKEFYWHLSSGISMDEPCLTAHWRAEGKIEYTALLYVPTMRPWDLYDPSRSHSVRLYVRRVFITDQCEGLIYPWLRFLKGVVDSQDLPLNISREMLQHNPVITKIRSGVARRVLGDLNKLSKDDKPSFEAFWEQFGSVLKEGLYDATEHRQDLFKVCRFRSSIDNGTELYSIKDYVDRMKDGQDTIYYISGEKLDTLVNSPQLEGFKSRGLEVLLMTDTIDEFWIGAVQDYEGKQFQSVTKGDIDLSKFENEKEADNQATDNNEEPEKQTDIDKLVAKISTILKDEIGQVRVSKRLTDSPVCLIAGDMEPDMRTEQILRIQQKYDAKSKRVLEINPDHSLIKYMNSIADEQNLSGELEEAAFLLLDQARIIQGDPVPDPTRFSRAMTKFMEKAFKAA